MRVALGVGVGVVGLLALVRVVLGWKTTRDLIQMVGLLAVSGFLVGLLDSWWEALKNAAVFSLVGGLYFWQLADARSRPPVPPRGASGEPSTGRRRMILLALLFLTAQSIAMVVFLVGSFPTIVRVVTGVVFVVSLTALLVLKRPHDRMGQPRQS